jgi:T5orf172 domain
MPSRTVGFVYVMSNRAMHGLVKVGLSSRLPEDRAKELHTTGVPYAFKVDRRMVTSWPVEVEHRAHDILAPFRVTSNREFFQTTPDVAIEAVGQAALEVAGIDAWAHQPIHRLRSGDRIALTLRAGQMFALVAYSDPLQLSAGSAEVLDLWQAHSDGDVLELLATDDPRHVAGLSDNDPGAEIDPVPFLNRAGDAPNGLINGRERLVPGDRLVWLGLQDGTTDCTSALFEAADYCQVVGRTWNPKASPDGWPPLVNVRTVDEFPTAMMEPIRQALALPVPREWAPRPSEESDGWPAPGTSPPSPAHWLRQLAPPPKRGKPAESGNRSPEGDE